MKKYVFFFSFLCCFIINSTAQNKLSDKATVSVVTCGPGSELFTAFGHSAFRVYDPLTGFDKIYNYGTFDFNAPNFYLNFAKGKLTYFLSTTRFNYFLQVYRYENRWVKTQELNLTPNEVQAIFNFLEQNAKPENRDYQYDFFYDNCSTKIEEVLTAVLKDKITFSNQHITTQKSHRDLIADYTKANYKWGKFGIDLALGSVIDDKATKDDYKFLPDYIFQAFNNASIQKNDHQEPLVKKTTTILNENTSKKTTPFFQPLIVFLLLSIGILFITIKNYKNQSRTKYLDFLLFFSTGIIGIVVLLLWFATSHTATYKNLNFLWAFAPNSIIAFYFLKSKIPTWLQFYILFLLLLLLGMGIAWISKIQVFNSALLPFILALAVRYSYLSNRLN